MLPRCACCALLTCRDEQNLEENERIKKELNPRKIGAPPLPPCALCPAALRRRSCCSALRACSALAHPLHNPVMPAAAQCPAAPLYPFCLPALPADEPKTPYLSPMDTDEEGDLGEALFFF